MGPFLDFSPRPEWGLGLSIMIESGLLISYSTALYKLINAGFAFRSYTSRQEQSKGYMSNLLAVYQTSRSQTR